MLQILDRESRVRRLAKKLPADLREELEKLDTLSIVDEMYFSRFRIAATLVTVASGVHTILFPAQTVKTFGYGIGESMANAGFPAAAPFLRATRSDTNLMKGGTTNNSEVFGIDSVALNFGARNDGEVIEQLLNAMYVAFSIGGSERNKSVGLPWQLTSSGGIYGQQESVIKTPGAFYSRAVHPGQQFNGVPHEAGGMDLGEVIPWGPSGRQGIDHMLTLDFELTRDVTIVGTARIADATTGVPAFTPPAAQTAVSDTRGTFLDCTAVMRGLALRGKAQY